MTRDVYYDQQSPVAIPIEVNLPSISVNRVPEQPHGPVLRGYGTYITLSRYLANVIWIRAYMAPIYWWQTTGASHRSTQWQPGEEKNRKHFDALCGIRTSHAVTRFQTFDFNGESS